MTRFASLRQFVRGRFGLVEERAFRPAFCPARKNPLGSLRSKTSATPTSTWAVDDAGLKAGSSTGEWDVDAGFKARSTWLAGGAVAKVAMACAGFLFVVCCLGLYG